MENNEERKAHYITPLLQRVSSKRLSSFKQNLTYEYSYQRQKGRNSQDCFNAR